MKPDSLIFDMDGTLWDAVDTYAHCWNLVLNENGIDVTLTGDDIKGYMGMEAKKIYSLMFPGLAESLIEKIYREIVVKTDEILPQMGGKVYSGVLEGLAKLAQKYKLFMLSNCQKGSIGDFMNFTATKKYFIDYIEYGSNHQPKHVNMNTLVQKYDLKAPMYIGDTDSDRKQCDLAGIPFIFVDFGFGTTETYNMKFSSFDDLTNYFMEL